LKSKKKGKYADELAKLKELNAIEEVLKKSDIENAALTNTSKDSETVGDNAVENMLNQLNLDKNANRNLEIVGRLAPYGKSGSTMAKSKSIKIKSTKKGMKVKSKIHIKKQKGSTTKRKKR
jgi:hypothetical protein